MRSRALLLLILVPLALALPTRLPTVGAIASTAPTIVGPKAYYLALGDSLAYGDQPNRQLFNGYADDFYAGLAPLGTSRLINMGCGSETTYTFVKGGCPGARYVKYLYTGPQLSAALAFIHAHPGQVSPVTIDLGTNDVAQLYDALTCAMATPGAIAQALASFDANLSFSMAQLQAALNGTGDLLIMTNYFAHQDRCPNVLPLVQTFNDHLVADAQHYGARVALVFDAFGGAAVPNPSLCSYTWICSPYRNIHGTTLGYCVIAAAFESAAGYGATPPGTCGSLSGTYTGSTFYVGARSSYTITVGASGSAAFASCAMATGDRTALYVYNSSGAMLSGGTSPSNCTWVSASVGAGQTYTVTTVAMSGASAYASAWSVNGAPVVWNVSGSIGKSGGSAEFGFPTLTGAPITLASCGPPGSTFALYLTDASGQVLAGTAQFSNCQSLTYPPGARGFFYLLEHAEIGTGTWVGTIDADAAVTVPISTTPTIPRPVRPIA